MNHMPFRPTLLRRCSQDKLDSFIAAISTFTASSSPSPPAGAVPAARTPAAYNKLMSAYSSVGRSDEVIRLFHSFPFPPTALLYTTLISSLAVSGCHHAARSTFASLLRSGLPLTPSAFTALLKLRTTASIDSWYKIVEAMDALGCSPDAAVYNCLILLLCDYQQVGEALGVLDLMAENGIYPNVRSYTAILKCYCEQGKVLHAERFVDAMIEVGCLPDVVSYSVLIDGLCSVGEFGMVERILEESEDKGWTPNAVTYNIYMSALCRMGFLDEAFRQFQIMESGGLSPTVETVNILFDCLCRGSMFTEAESLLGCEELGWDVDVFCYNTLMSRLCDAGGFVKVLKLLVDLLKKGIGPDVFSFTIAIRSLCRGGKLQLAKCLMENEGIGYDVVAFNTMLHGFLMVGDVQSVRLTYNYMISRNVLPNDFSKAMVIDSYCKEQNSGAAVKFFLEYSGDRYVHDHFLRLNNWLVKERQLSYVRYLLDELRFQGFALDVCIFNSLVRIFCFEGYCKHEIEIVSHMLDSMLAKVPNT
jgi:pentatricopeptide repeat protein